MAEAKKKAVVVSRSSIVLPFVFSWVVVVDTWCSGVRTGCGRVNCTKGTRAGRQGCREEMPFSESGVGGRAADLAFLAKGSGIEATGPSQGRATQRNTAQHSTAQRKHKGFFEAGAGWEFTM